MAISSMCVLLKMDLPKKKRLEQHTMMGKRKKKREKLMELVKSLETKFASKSEKVLAPSPRPALNAFN